MARISPTAARRRWLVLGGVLLGILMVGCGSAPKLAAPELAARGGAASDGVDSGVLGDGTTMVGTGSEEAGAPTYRLADATPCTAPSSVDAVPSSQNVAIDVTFADGAVRQVLAEFDLPPAALDELREQGLVVTVSASDRTDYVTDGVDDQIEINLATAQVYAAGGGIVYLHAGTYIVSDSVYVWDHTTLKGAGRVGQRRTTIALADAAPSMAGEAGIVRLKNDLAKGLGERVFDARIEDFVIDGNRDNQPMFLRSPPGVLPETAPDQEKKYGFYAEGERIVAQRITVQNSMGYGFDPHEYADHLGSQVSILDSYALNNLSDGFTLDAIFGSLLANNVSWGNGRHGFNLVTGSHDMTVCGNVSYENGLSPDGANPIGAGIQIQKGSDPATPDSNNIRVRDNSVFGNGRSGIEMRGAFESEVSGNYVTANGHAGIRLRGADRNVITGNVVQDNNVTNGSGHEISLDDYSDGVSLASGSDENTLIGNRLSNTSGRLLSEGPLARGNTRTDNVLRSDR